MASGVPIDPRVSLSQIIFKNVLNGANWTSVALLGSQSNSGVPPHFLVRHKRGCTDAVFKGGEGEWTSTRHSAECTDSVPPCSHDPFFSVCVCELLLMKLAPFWCCYPQRNRQAGGESPPSGRAQAAGDPFGGADTERCRCLSKLS